MKKLGPVSVMCKTALLAVLVATSGGPLRAHAQITATLIDSSAEPRFGTYWRVQHTNEPPLPMDPFKGALPVYALSTGSNIFVIDDRDVDYVAWYALLSSDAAVETVPMKSSAVALTSAVASLSTTAAADAPSIPIPPGAGDTGTNTDPGGITFTPMAYGSQDLWLGVSVSNSLASFVIHTPDSSAMYDLFGTSNLAPNVPGLNLTNWVWLGRTTTGQTNYVVANLWPAEGFFRLGTMLDSNADGVTDAYSNLVGLNSNSDLDGDGVSDVEEMREGRNPMIAGAVADTNGLARLDVFTVLR